MTTQAQNHPAAESIISVEPIRSLEDVSRVKAILSGRNLVMFTLGVNTNLRASDLLALTMGSVDFRRGEMVLREKKTGKKRYLPLSVPVMIMLTDYCKPTEADDPNRLLFTSIKGGGQIGVSALNHLVKKWCDTVGLRGNFGSHTLRKTWAYSQYKIFGTDLAEISHQLNHSSMNTTYRYLGITPDSVKIMYSNFI